MNAIEVSHVSKMYRRYGRRRDFGTLKSALLSGNLFRDLRPDSVLEALKDVSFDVSAGRTFGIIGRNGSGKSTMLKMIAGIGKPTSGVVKVNGRVSALIELGAGFHPEISGRENVFINGMMLGLTKKDIADRFDDIVAFAELEDFIDAPVKTYSSGMYMRLGFAVAINVDPDVLLVDEVLAVGDQGFTHKCLDKFAEFRRRGRTVLLVTHSLDMVTRFCDEALWLDSGHAKAQGEPQRVIDAYLAEVARSEQGTHPLTSDTMSREVEILGVRMLAGDGLSASTISSGDGVSMHARLRAQERVDDLVLSFSIFNADGIRCCVLTVGAPGSGEQRSGDQRVASVLRGEGTVTCVIDRLDIVSGTYTLDLVAHRRDGTPYDHNHRCTFTVSAPTRNAGIFDPPHRWQTGGGLTLDTTDGSRQG